MMRLWSLVEAVSDRSCTLLIQGESGTGKEFIARHVHAMSGRSDGPFIPVDCTTLRDTLFESQLFGHVKGAFTGADQATLGFFRTADGGTLLLDEIGEMSLLVQAKLLRCIQDRAVIPLGGTRPIPVDVRIVVATHRDLKAMVHRGEFRQDLYFRLNVVRLAVPPLRERQSDITPLAEHFLGHFASLYGEPVKELSPEVTEALAGYEWPGNVRELANIMEQAHVLSKQACVAVTDLPQEIRLAGGDPALWQQILSYNRDHVLSAMQEYGSTLAAIYNAIRDDDQTQLEEILTKAKKNRDALGS